MPKKILQTITFSFLLAFQVSAQQNHLMFFSHYLPEANLLNPAVQSPCKWYVGIPVFSSIHVNAAHSGFSYRQLVRPSEGTNVLDVDGVVDRLGRRTFVGTEFHTQLFAVGHRRNDYYFSFSITEKDNTPSTYSRDALRLAWDGNTQFLGEEANLKGTGTYFTHYREFALGISKVNERGVFFGGKAKLLYGKLNISTRKMDIGIFTDETTYNLDFSGEMLIHSSLPIVIVNNDEGEVEGIELAEDIDYMNLIFNRKNLGLAFDAGFIYPYNEKITISGSIIDVGFIRWRSNQHNFRGDGDFIYDGPLNDSITESNGYFNDLLQAFSDSMHVVATEDNYTTFLPTRFNIGATYQVNEYFQVGGLASAILHRSKLLPSLTLSGDFRPRENLHLLAGYTLQYGSFNNIGLGFVAGKGPVQYYMYSDNALGAIFPLRTRNLNLRFGINLNLGCHIKEPGEDKEYHPPIKGECAWIDETPKRKKRKGRKR